MHGSIEFNLARIYEMLERIAEALDIIAEKLP